MAYTQDWRTDAAPEPVRVRLLRVGIIALSAALGTMLMLATLPGERAPAVPAAAPPAPTAPPQPSKRRCRRACAPDCRRARATRSPSPPNVSPAAE